VSIAESGIWNFPEIKFHHCQISDGANLQNFEFSLVCWNASNTQTQHQATLCLQQNQMNEFNQLHEMNAHD